MCTKKPIIKKIYKFGKKFDPETGEDLGEMGVAGSKLEYFYEVPKTKAERIRFINSFIENSKGTFAENIFTALTMKAMNWAEVIQHFRTMNL